MKKKTKKIGLALGGGGARGCAHIGVIKALQKANIPIDYIAGCSIGAVVGGIFATGGLNDFETYLTKLTKKDILTKFDPVWMKNGFFGGEKATKILEQFLGKKTFRGCKIPFSAVATDLIHGKEVVLSKGSLKEAIRASISLPGVFTTVKKSGTELVDGGVINPLPVNVVRKMGAEIVIAVDLNYHYIQHKKHSRIKQKGNQKKHRSTFGVVESALFLMLDQITEKNLQTHPADVLLRMDLGDISVFDFSQVEIMLEEGYTQMKKQIKTVKKMIL